MLQDNQQSYGLVTRIFHWGMAVLVLWQMLKFADDIADGEHWVAKTLVPYHGSIGLVLMALVIFRLLWVFTQRNVRRKQTSAGIMAKLGHYALYLLLVLVPLSAICLMLGRGFGLKAFGYQLVERGSTKSELLASLGSWHASLATLLAIMILGHIGFALWHHFVKRDGTMKKIW